MIILHKNKDHEASQSLEERLKDLVISYKTREHDQKDGLPAIEENGKFYRSEEEIDRWLIKLESELTWQRSLSGDGCYIRPDQEESC